MYGFAVGGGRSPYNAETELLSINDWTWSSRAQYPFTNYIYGYATLIHNEVFIVFGGYGNGQYESTIAQYNPNDDTWTKLGDLNNARYHHDVITSEDAFLIVGDYYPTEKCTLTGNTMNCINQEPNVSRYG